MKELCLLVALAASLAGCASTTGAGTGKTAPKESLSDNYIPTGTLFARKRAGAGANTTVELDRQALENEQMSNAGTNHGR